MTTNFKATNEAFWLNSSVLAHVNAFFSYAP